MARALGHDLDDEALAALFGRTGGNAFFSEEILLAADGAVPWTIADAVMRRLQVLASAPQQAATVLAVAVDPLPRSTLDAIVGDPSAVGDLLDAGIARQGTDTQVSLRHALVGEVVQRAPGRTGASTGQPGARRRARRHRRGSRPVGPVLG